MKKMDLNTAYKIATTYDGETDLSEDELTEYIDALEYLIEHEPSYPVAWMFCLANAYDTIGRYQLAIKYYQIGIDEGDKLSYLGLGDTYMHIHEYQKALQCYQKALDCGYYKARKRIKELREVMSNGPDQD